MAILAQAVRLSTMLFSLVLLWPRIAHAYHYKDLKVQVADKAICPSSRLCWND